VIEDGALRQRLAAAGRSQVERGFHLARNVTLLADILRGLPAVQAPALGPGAQA
jgi:hypothetical protein